MRLELLESSVLPRFLIRDAPQPRPMSPYQAVSSIFEVVGYAGMCQHAHFRMAELKPRRHDPGNSWPRAFADRLTFNPQLKALKGGRAGRPRVLAFTVAVGFRSLSPGGVLAFVGLVVWTRSVPPARAQVLVLSSDQRLRVKGMG